MADTASQVVLGPYTCAQHHCCAVWCWGRMHMHNTPVCWSYMCMRNAMEGWRSAQCHGRVALGLYKVYQLQVAFFG